MVSERWGDVKEDGGGKEGTTKDNGHEGVE
jgi:hypothetical protein